MPTNEERREVARSLREIDTSDDPLNSTAMDVKIEEAIGVREVADKWPTYEWCIARNRKYLNRLADLIEPDTCRIEYDTVHLDYACSKCGEIFETGTYYSINDGDEAVLKDFKHCPNCGAKVENKDDN